VPATWAEQKENTGSCNVDGVSRDLDFDTVIADSHCPAYQFTGGGDTGDTTSGVTLLAMSGIELLSLVVIVGIEESIKAFRT
jgi:hypothetical protein